MFGPADDLTTRLVRKKAQHCKPYSSHFACFIFYILIKVRKQIVDLFLGIP